MRAAIVSVNKEKVIVVCVEKETTEDPRKANVALVAIEAKQGHAAVLFAREPCGCQQLVGRDPHIKAIDKMIDGLEWTDVDIDLLDGIN